MVHPRGRLHRQEGGHLKQMVLHHISDCADFIIKFSSSRDTELLGHRNLNAMDVVAVPDRFEKGVGEAKEEEILNRLFAKIMVYPEDIGFRKDRAQRGVQGSGGGEISSKRLLKNNPGVVCTACLLQSFNDRFKEAGGNGQVV